MPRLIYAFLMVALGACSSGDSSGSCPHYAAAGGNNFSSPSYQWDATHCACTPSQLDLSAAGGSCNRPQDCADTCCTCPGSSGWTFNASVCMNHSCLDQAAACQAVLAATGEPCK